MNIPRVVSARPSSGCSQRMELSQAVARAVQLTFEAKAALDDARQRNGGDIDALLSTLRAARAFGRTADRALRQHVEEHRCRF